MHNIKVDFSKTVGKVKALNGVNCAPYSPILGPNQTTVQDRFTAAHIPYSRLHDCGGSWGGTHFVDIPNVFPNFDADENDPANYDFYYTDEYIKAIQDAGAEAYYRLGVTIEWGSKKYTSIMPKDFSKWARICEHVIMHYNEGWADGFHYNLKYWEIWNEPDNPGTEYGSCMWSGTKEDFYDLYKTASIYLKSKFPNIKIGGYGSCGFYAVTRDNVSDAFKSFVPYFTDFLEMVKKENCPLDFFSWHIYTGDEKEIFAHAKYVRETLDSYGFEATESHLNEWNIGSEGKNFAEKHTMEGGSFLAAVMCKLQNTNYVDQALYYCFSPAAGYNGFRNHNDGSIAPSWYPFCAFGELYVLQNAVLTEHSDGIYAAAATDGKEYAVLISNYNSEEKETTICLKGIEDKKKLSVLYCTEEKHLEKEFSFVVSGENEIELNIPKHTSVLIKG